MLKKSYRWRGFEEARDYVRSLGLKDLSEWLAWAKSEARPDFIPANPSVIYKHRGWVNIGDWLGNDYIFKRGGNWRSFEEAREFVRSLGLNTLKEWRAWYKSSARPRDIPADPTSVYRQEGWKGFGDWLGTGRIACQKRIYRPFIKARAYARNLGLNSLEEWLAWSKEPEIPKDIPACPDKTYKRSGEWKGWPDWLGN